jgi:hypothetical protein
MARQRTFGDSWRDLGLPLLLNDGSDRRFLPVGHARDMLFTI